MAAVMPGTTSNAMPRAPAIQLLAAAAEHERIAALQAHDVPAGASVFQHQRVDAILRDDPRPPVCRR